MPIRLSNDRLYFSADILASCLQCRGPLVRCGLLPDGGQRLLCKPCGVRIQASYSHSRIYKNKVGKYRLAAYLLGMGRSIREVESLVGISKKTVNDIRKSIMRNADVLCGCGQEIGHKGWCSFRYDRSPARQAFMSRMGRPPKEVSIELINLLRSQGKPVREIAALLGVHRGTINLRLAEQREAGRQLPWFCVGRFNLRASLAIRRYRLLSEPLPSGDAFSETMNELWIAARDSGCPSCGAVRKQSNSFCRRCITVRLVIERAESAIVGTIRGLINEAQQPLKEFMDSLSQKRGLRPAQRLRMLVEQVSGNERNIQAQG